MPWAKPDRIPDNQHFAPQWHFLWSVEWIFMGRFVDLDICNRGAGDMHGAGTVETQNFASVHGADGDIHQGACILNSDGTYDIEMVIEFWPQRWFYLGLLISGTTFFGCIGYLGWDFVRRRKRKLSARGGSASG